MNTVAKACLIAGGIGLVFLLVFGASLGSYWMQVYNHEVSLRNQASAQQKNLENVFDQTWKTISGVAKVSEKYAADFREIYPKLMDARYGKGDGTLMKWIQEHNPQFDTSLYAKVSNAVENYRGQFAFEQKKLLDIKRQHDDLRLSFPSKFFIGNSSEIVVVLVTSSVTKAAFATGEDNASDPFSEPKPGPEK